MFIVKRRSEVLRFGLFLVLVGLMAYYVAGKFSEWRVSRAPAATVPTQGPLIAGPQTADPVGSATGGTADGVDFFAEFRMGRERNRGALKETLKEVMDSQSADADTRKVASQQYLAAGRTASLEDQAEQLIRAKGFDDALVNLMEGTAQVVVKAHALSQQQFLQLVDLVSRVTGVKAAGVQVMSKDR